MTRLSRSLTFFFFNDTATTEIYTLSLHDALPILKAGTRRAAGRLCWAVSIAPEKRPSTSRSMRSSTTRADRKSTRLNSSHQIISYAVFCLKKKKQKVKHSTDLTTFCFISLSLLQL